MAGQRKALIIANDTYAQEALRDLVAPAADAEALGRVLGDPQIGAFAVQVVHNEPAHVIQANVEEVFSESRPDDVLVLHYSGHGLKSDSGELFFAASNTRPNRLGSTAVSADFVQRCMRASRSRSVVLLLDCCYGGAFPQGVRVRAAGDVNVLDSFPRESSGRGRGRAVITASSAMEFAFEGNQLGDDQQNRPSVFTTALVEGLATGEADRDEDGWVSLDELYDYLFDKVREQNPHQTPSRQFELEGELYLARSNRRRVRPAPIPAELQAALADPNVYTRLGAVSELRSRLASENLAAAIGAHEVLRKLADSDVSYIAGPAAAALRYAALHPAQGDLHFGRVDRGSEPPHQRVKLLGPPIARACVPSPSHDWIRVQQVADALDITIDTAGTGLLRGSVGLKGPTGEAVIAVDIDLVSPAPVPGSHPGHSGIRPAGRQPAGRATVPGPAGEASGAPASYQPQQYQGQRAGGSAGEPPRPAFAGRRGQAPPDTAPWFTPHPASQPPVPPVLKPAPIRTRTAFAGLCMALLAGVAGLISHVLQQRQTATGPYFFFEQTYSAVPIAVAVTGLLLHRHRRATLGLLQGLWWPSASWLAWGLAGAASKKFSLTGNDYHIGILSDALGVIAALFLLASWNPGACKDEAERRAALPVALICGVILSQAAALYVYSSAAFHRGPQAHYTQGVVALAVGLAVSWYAVRLRAKFLGGMLLLGWVTSTIIRLIATVLHVREATPYPVPGSVVLEFLLLAVVLILTIIYIWRPREPIPRPIEQRPGVPLSS